jgi:hypothetical protein
VPPRSAFNSTTRYISILTEEYASIDNPLKTLPKGKIKQGGTGYYSFCEDCNNFLGLNYVTSYERWVKIAAEVLKTTKNESNHYSFIAHNIEPLKILKHIVSMFLAMNPDWYFEEYPGLIDFVRNVKSKSLPDRFRVFLYLNNEGNLRLRSHTTMSTPDYGIVNCSELAFPPVGHVLTLDYKSDIKILTEITGFKNYGIDFKDDLPLETFKLPTYLPLMPLDYRSKSEVEKAIDQGLIDSKKFESQIAELKRKK